MLLIHEDDVEQILTTKMCMEAVEEAYRKLGTGTAMAAVRQNLWLDPQKSIKFAAGGVPGSGMAGVIAYSAGYGKKGSGPSSTLLYDSKTGELLAFVESKYLGLCRTGATSAVAAKFLRLKGSDRFGIIGTGRQARSQAKALSEAFALKSLVVFSRTTPSKIEFAEEMSRTLGVDVRTADSAEDCVSRSDVVVTITTSRDPVIKGEWLRDGVLVNALGSHQPTATEVDTETALSSRVIVDFKEQALLEKGEILLPISRGLATQAIVKGELGEVVVGRIKARERDEDKVLFCSGGVALEQVEVAARVYQEAVRRGLGGEA